MAHDFFGPGEEEIPEEVVMEGQGEPEELEVPAQPLPEQFEAAVPDRGAPGIDPLILDGVELSAASSLSVLKAAASQMGLSTSGSKTRLFNRVKSYMEKQKLSLEVELAADAVAQGSREPRVPPVPKEPSPQERLLHEATHLPYASWCPHCIAMRALPDRMENLKDAPRDVPSIAYDFCFTGFDATSNSFVCHDKEPESGEALKCMVAHDSHTGSVLAVPCLSKGDVRHLSLELMRFAQSLGHVKIELRCDNEPSTLNIQKAVINARQRLGLQTIERNPPVGAHASQGYVEKAVDCIRKMANTLLDMVRQRTGLVLGSSHPIFAWAFGHAAWLLNRYRVTGNLTSYERACGARYSGRIVPFGEPVFCQVVPKQKGNARWLLGIFLGKSSNDMYIVGGPGGVRLSRSVRRTGRSWSDDAKLYDTLSGQPWDYGSGVLGTRFVPAPKLRKPEVHSLPDGQAGSGVGALEPRDEAASLPPSSHDGAATPASPSPLSPSPMPPTPLPKSRARVPPPASAQVDTSAPAAYDPYAPGAVNPSVQAEVPGVVAPSTPEHMLPPLMGDSSAVGTEAAPAQMDVEASMSFRGDDANERAPKVPRIRTVHFGGQEYAINDDTGDVQFEELWDFEAAMWADDPEDDSGDYAGMSQLEEQAEGDERLWFPNTGREPVLSAQAMQELDMLADAVEVSRLVAKGVLREAGSQEDLSSMKTLSTKMVRTWRAKKKSGQPMYLRRSRLCAREFRWLDASKEGLFSPATSSDIVRLTPALFLSWKQTRPDIEYAIVSLDIKDAYLEVDQPEPVVSTIEVRPGVHMKFVFQKMVPGQREGSSRWFQHFVTFLSEHFAVSQCPECPAIIKLPEGPGMIHVDDSILLLPLQWALNVFLPVVRSRFQVTVEMAWKCGDEFSFLKRKHTILDDRIVIQQPPQYIEHMAAVLGVKPNNRQRVPCMQELRDKDTSELLSPSEASKFRAAVGTGLCISADRPDIGYTIRLLASSMASPTRQALRGLVKLVQYLLNTCNYATSICIGPPGSSKLLSSMDVDCSNDMPSPGMLLGC